MLTWTPNLSESCGYIRRYEKRLDRQMHFFLLKFILIPTYIQRTKLPSWILSVLLKSCDTIHSHIFCTPCRAAGSDVCSLYEVSTFSVLFSFAYMSQYKLNVLLTWLSWLLCFEWQSERSFDKWLTTRACFVCLHCYGRTIRRLLHFVTKQPKRFCIVFCPLPKIET